MKILLMENTFSGAHGSFKTFFDEIDCALKSLGHEVFRVNDIFSAATVYERHSPAFSLSIGKYSFVIDSKPLFKIYSKPHYQWIIDNPLKMPYICAENFTPIFIDREFVELYEPPPKYRLYLPLGITPTKNNFVAENRTFGIVFAGQVKNLNALRNEIMHSSQRALIEKFLNFMESNLNASFILQYKKFLAENIIVDKAEFFRLTNSYLRSLKRWFILEKIRNYPLILAGNIAEKSLLQKPNVVYVGELPYSELPKLFSGYTHVLHISPNFSACIHDRILRGLQAGGYVIAEKNAVLTKTFGNTLTYFDYKNFDERNVTKLFAKNIDDERKILSQFYWRNILSEIVEDYNRRDNIVKNGFGLH